MKKYFLLLLLLIIPYSVFAETCDPNNITLKSIELSNTTGSAEDLETNVENNKINLNVKLKDVGDTAEYDVVLNNKSSEKYYLNDTNIVSSNEYINYEVTYDDGTNVIKPKSDKALNIKVEYKKEVPDELLNNNRFVESSSFNLAISNIQNPKTKNYFYIIVLCIYLVLLFFSFFLGRNVARNMFVGITLIFLIPLSAYAVCNVNCMLDTNVVISNGPDITIFDKGKIVNTKMKLLLTGGEYTGQDLSETQFFECTGLVRSSEKPDTTNFTSVNILSAPDSNKLIYAWKNSDDYIMWYSDSSDVYFNEDSSYFFNSLGLCFGISGIENVSIDYVTNMAYMFSGIDAFDNYSFIRNWDVSRVTNMEGMFQSSVYLNFDNVKDWNVSNVTNMSYMFAYVLNYDSLSNYGMSNYHSGDPSVLSGWDVRNVTNFDYMFLAESGTYGVDLSSYTLPIFTLRSGSWDNSVVAIDSVNYYSGTYLNYAYYYKSTTNNSRINDLGKNISEVSNLLTDETIAINTTYSNYYLRAAFRYKVVDDIVEEINIVFKWNNQIVYLVPSTNSYNTNKGNMIEVFGYSRCGDETSQYGEGQFYICHEFYPAIYAGDGDAAGFNVSLYKNGSQVVVADLPYSMALYSDGTAWIWRYM